MTAQVITRWYRPPELLFGAREYTYGVDIWSVGCIFAELMLRTPYMPGENDLDQLNTIFRALGTPDEKDWPGMNTLPDFMEFKKYPKPRPGDWSNLFSAAPSEALDLLQKMLKFDPSTRISAKESLLHQYFRSRPQPTPPEKLPKLSRPEKGQEGVIAALKRKAGDDLSDDDDSASPKKSIARKLEFA